MPEDQERVILNGQAGEVCDPPEGGDLADRTELP